MGAKQDDAHKRKEKERSPSTGRGAASALDALIKRRAPTPGQNQQAPPDTKKR